MSMILWTIFIAVMPWPASAAISSDFARKLVELRGEVEEAGSAYEEALLKRKTVLEPVQMRHSELEAQLGKEELRGLQLKEKLKAAKTGGGSRPAGREDEWAILDKWAQRLGAYVDSTIPFRRKERQDRVKALVTRIKQRRESRIAVAADLWSVTEKELSLTKDVEYRIGKLPLGGSEADGEIARLGMAHMLFLGSSGVAGFSKQTNGKWELVNARDAAESGAVERLVSRLKAKSANGWYEIPGLESIPREDAE